MSINPWKYPSTSLKHSPFLPDEGQPGRSSRPFSKANWKMSSCRLEWPSLSYQMFHRMFSSHIPNLTSCCPVSSFLLLGKGMEKVVLASTAGWISTVFQQTGARGLHVCLRRDKEASLRARSAFPSFCALPPPNAVSVQSLPLAFISALRHHEVLLASFTNSRNFYPLFLKYLSLFRSMLKNVFKEVGS